MPEGEARGRKVSFSPGNIGFINNIYLKNYSYKLLNCFQTYWLKAYVCGQNTSFLSIYFVETFFKVKNAQRHAKGGGGGSMGVHLPCTGSVKSMVSRILGPTIGGEKE